MYTGWYHNCFKEMALQGGSNIHVIPTHTLPMRENRYSFFVIHCGMQYRTVLNNVLTRLNKFKKPQIRFVSISLDKALTIAAIHSASSLVQFCSIANKSHSPKIWSEIEFFMEECILIFTPQHLEHSVKDVGHHELNKPILSQDFFSQFNFKTAESLDKHCDSSPVMYKVYMVSFNSPACPDREFSRYVCNIVDGTIRHNYGIVDICTAMSTQKIFNAIEHSIIHIQYIIHYMVQKYSPRSWYHDR